MNYNNSPRPDNRLKTLLFVLLCLLLVGGIVYMKRSSSEGKMPSGGSSPSSSDRPVAVPDTSAAPGTASAEPDSVVPSVLPDTLLGRDKRPPYEAGYEDGYSAGCDDGAAGQERAGYDESSGFASAAAREAYASGYRKGYAKGYADGREGKQFNI